MGKPKAEEQFVSSSEIDKAEGAVGSVASGAKGGKEKAPRLCTDVSLRGIKQYWE